jgi:proline iminopeptidase
MDVRTIVEGVSGILAIGGTLVLSPLLAPWYRAWGATEEEARRSLPGDELVPAPKSELTCALTVQAPVEKVWPWLVQLGCQRAGWYSYDLLDNGRVPSANQILPEHQHLSVGDRILLTPDGRLGLPVVDLEPEKSLVLGGTLDTRTGEGVSPGEPLPEAYYSGINVFVLQQAGEGVTRLIFRQRLDWNPGFANTLMYRVFLEPVSFVMGRKMLKGLKQRAEAL